MTNSLALLQLAVSLNKQQPEASDIKCIDIHTNRSAERHLHTTASVTDCNLLSCSHCKSEATSPISRVTNLALSPQNLSIIECQ